MSKNPQNRDPAKDDHEETGPRAPWRLFNALFDLSDTSGGSKEYLEAAVRAVKDYSNMRCAGIRILDKSGNIPFEAYTGYSEQFWSEENWLSVEWETCACIRLITGEFVSQNTDVATSRGSFYCGDLSEFFSLLTEAERRKVRDRCLKEGFNSVAVIPIRRGDRILGAIHLADERKNALSAGALETLEFAAFLIWESMHRMGIGENLKAAEAELSSFLVTVPDCICYLAPDGRYLSMNSAGLAILGMEEQAEILGKSCLEGVIVNRDELEEALRRAVKGETVTLCYSTAAKSGKEVWWETRLAPVVEHPGGITRILQISRDVSEQKQAEEALRRSGDTATAINRLLSLSLKEISLQELLEETVELILSIPWLVFKSKGSIFLLENKQLLLKAQRGMDEPLKKACARLPLGRCLCGRAALTGEVQYAVGIDERHEVYFAEMEPHGHYCVPIRSLEKIYGVLNLYLHEGHRRDEKEEAFLVAVADALAGVIERKKAEEVLRELNEELERLVQERTAALARTNEALQRRLSELETVCTVSSALRSEETLEKMLPALLGEILAVLNTGAGAIWLYDPASGELRFATARGWFTWLEEVLLKPGEGIAGEVFVSGKVYISRELVADLLVKPQARERIPPGWGGACIPIRVGAEIVGVLFVSVPLPREITPEEVKLLTSLSEMAGTALHRINLHEETVRRLHQLQALRAVDAAVNASQDLRLTLSILLENVTALMGVDAAAVFLLHPHLKVLEYAAGRGFSSRTIEQIRLRLGEACPGMAALERHSVIVSAPAEARDEKCAALLQSQGFAACVCVPLIAKGEVKGVLEVLWEKSFRPDNEWLGFLETLAGQAAIAVDNARLFDELQRTNLELVLAYDATIEGWSHALDLRDRETEGHTRRVTEMTVTLARALGIPETKLVHLRRGALLHDIGKMGVPDTILLKPGRLTEQEWEVMHRHPQLAYTMLSRIDYLRPALEIPYCHHEKWDGSGYPRGLKGEEIPLEARIFAVADVYDALTSDRPYRSAMAREQALEYIRRESGKHFDPRVVKVFLEQVIQDSFGT